MNVSNIGHFLNRENEKTDYLSMYDYTLIHFKIYLPLQHL